MGSKKLAIYIMDMPSNKKFDKKLSEVTDDFKNSFLYDDKYFANYDDKEKIRIK